MSTILLSQRATVGGLAEQLAFGAWHEAEDVLVETGVAELLLSDLHGRSPQVRARRIAGRAVRRTVGRRQVLPASAKTDIDRAVDHVIFVGHGPWDLPLLERIGAVRRQAKTITLWLPEIWPSQMEDRRIWYECYTMIDRIFVGLPDVIDDFGSVAPNSDVHHLPPACDVIRFAGSVAADNRPIAVLGIGRRHALQHQAILDWAQENDALYLYDTVRGKAPDWLEHRQALAGWYRHAAVAVCNFGKHDQPDVTGGLRTIPGRLFEGLAAGCLMVGLAPDEDRQRSVVGRVVAETVMPEEMATVLDQCVKADRMADRFANIATAARGHDWAHRWAKLFTVADGSVPEGLSSRLAELDDLADAADRRVGRGE